MPIDLDTRLADYARTIDDAIEHSIDRAESSLPEAPAASSGRGALVGLAAAAVAVLGLGMFAVAREDAGAPATQPLDTLPAVDPAANPPPSRGSVIDVPRSASDFYMPPWDPIRIAPGTIGWFEAGDDLPPEIASLPQNETIPDDTARSAFFVCASWTIDADSPICDRLAGGNGIEHVTYGDRLGIGVGLGDTTPQDQLWNQASGSLWAYDAFTEPPEPTIIPVGEVDGVSYRNGDAAYLAWEYEPGVVVWLRGNGLSDDELSTIAEGVRPAPLPAELPVLLRLSTPSVGDTGPGGTSNEASVKLGYLDGRPCVGIQMWETCVPTDAPALFGAAVFGDGQLDQYAAIAPTGTDLTFEATTFGAGTQRIDLVPTDFDFDLAVWESTGSRLLSARLVDATGTMVADTGELDVRPTDPRPVVAEGTTNGIDWIVQRQDPAQQAQMNEMYFGPTESATIPYCLLLSASGEFAPLCPPPEPPASGLGIRADYHETLDMVEIATDVTSVRCDGVDMTIFVDDQLDGRRFVVVSCDDPKTT